MNKHELFKLYATLRSCSHNANKQLTRLYLTGIKACEHEIPFEITGQVALALLDSLISQERLLAIGQRVLDEHLSDPRFATTPLAALGVTIPSQAREIDNDGLNNGL